MSDFDLLKWLASLIPEDQEDKAGMFGLELEDFDTDIEWLATFLGEYHDNYYRVGPACGMRLSEVDARCFKGASILATLPELDWMVQCKRIKQLCYWWPKMRSAGHYLYNRHPVIVVES